MNRGLRLRIFLAVIIPLLILAFILSFYFITVRVGDARFGLEEQGRRHADYFAAASEFNLLAGNKMELQNFIDYQAKAAQLITAIAFVDSAGEMIAYTGAEDEITHLKACMSIEGNCNLFDARLFFNKPIFTEGVIVSENPELNPDNKNESGEILGRVVFFYDTQPLRELQSEMTRDGLLITIAAVSFAAILALIFANGFIRPVVNLSRVVKEIQKGNLSARTNPIGRGELRSLENGVNQMAAIVEQGKENLQFKIEKATEELLDTLRQLKHKNKDLEEARNRAEEAGKIKDLFLARMSHELRTPLSSVIGYLKLMEDVEDTEQRKAYGKIVDQASTILLTTINDILDFIRLEDGSVRLEKIEFNLGECLQTAMAMQQAEAEKKQLQLTCNLSENLPNSLYGDPSRIAQIVTNLLSNAIKFTFKGTVKLEADSKRIDDQLVEVAISVSDTGIGIPRKMQTRLFKPFVQAEDSISRRFGGSGLGLSIVHRLVTSMDGYISLVSDTDAGTTITVYIKLPLAAEDLEPEAIRPPVKTSMDVLVVEDNDLSRQLIKIQLQAFGANVTDVDSGYKAIAAVKQQVFDLILMDVHMPNMDGIALAPELYTLAPDTLIYALTANITGSEEKQLLDSGVAGILYKPLNEAVIEKILNLQILEKQNAPAKKAVTRSETRRTQLILPEAIKAENVISELNNLLTAIRKYLNDENWTGVLETAHKLLGSAKLFTEGPLSDQVQSLEDSANSKNKSLTGAVIEKIQAQIDSLEE